MTAFDLLAALDPAQRKTAVIAEKALDEVRTAGQPLPPTDAPAGLAAANMTEPQQKLLRSLVEAYAENMPDEVAAERLASLKDGGFAKLHFAWAGADKPGIGHYYRVQGADLLAEYDNTQRGANHVHTVWRNPHLDFGADVLRAHYEAGRLDPGHGHDAHPH